MPSRKNTASAEDDTEFRLLVEFERVRNLLEVTDLIGVVWKPDQYGRLSGEVKNGTVYIYEADKEKALQTLRHEMIDYQITSNLIQPLVDLVNLLIKSKENEVYKSKERVIERLSKLL